MSDEATLEPAIASLTATAMAPDELGVSLTQEPTGDATALPWETEAVRAREEPARDWREELAAKMQDYRARRKPRAPKYPSLQMPLQLPVEPPPEPLEAFETFRSISADASRSSNALEPSLEPEPEGPQLGPELVKPASLAETMSAPATTNLIEFPRSMESAAWDGLAEPVIEQPRILDAPELAPPEPALGGILLEAPEDANPSAVADEPLRPASIARRFVAVILDAIPVGCGIVLWGWMVSKITHEIPPRPQLLISASMAAGVLWLSYQYLLMVYSGTTLGLRACRLELVALDGSIPGRKQRRWRLLASVLSAASIMLGYAWVLLDENRLCWHDRISRTYLRVRERQSL